MSSLLLSQQGGEDKKNVHAESGDGDETAANMLVSVKGRMCPACGIATVTATPPSSDCDEDHDEGTAPPENLVAAARFDSSDRLQPSEATSTQWHHCGHCGHPISNNEDDCASDGDIDGEEYSQQYQYSMPFEWYPTAVSGKKIFEIAMTRFPRPFAVGGGGGGGGTSVCRLFADLCPEVTEFLATSRAEKGEVARVVVCANIGENPNVIVTASPVTVRYNALIATVNRLQASGIVVAHVAHCGGAYDMRSAAHSCGFTQRSLECLGARVVGHFNGQQQQRQQGGAVLSCEVVQCDHGTIHNFLRGGECVRKEGCCEQCISRFDSNIHGRRLRDSWSAYTETGKCSSHLCLIITKKQAARFF